MSDQEDKPVLHHLHLSDPSPIDEEEITLADGKTAKVLWKDVLVEGEYPMSPGPNGATSDPMRVITDGASDPKTKTISMSDLEASHKDGAHKYVTIPTSHRDGLLDNTGYVPQPSGLRRVEKKGKTVLQAALGFTEPDIKGKVQRGTIPDVSAGIFFGFVNKYTKKRYPSSLKHVALTPTPFMGNLDPFPAVFASDDDIPENVEVQVYNFDDGDSSDDKTEKKVIEIAWDEKKSHMFVTKRINEQLNPQLSPDEMDMPRQPRPSYYVQDVAHDDNTALVEEYFKGNSTRFVIPWSREGDDITIAPSTRWVEVREAMIAASDQDFESVSTEAVKEKLGVALSEMLGKTDAIYRVDAVTFDGRARVICRAKGKKWIARFSQLDDGSVWLSPADQWEALKAPANKLSLSEVITPPGASDRLTAARQQRRHLVA